MGAWCGDWLPRPWARSSLSSLMPHWAPGSRPGDGWDCTPFSFLLHVLEQVSTQGLTCRPGCSCRQMSQKETWT